MKRYVYKHIRTFIEALIIVVLIVGVSAFEYWLTTGG